MSLPTAKPVGIRPGKQQPLSFPSFHPKTFSHNYPRVSISDFRVMRQRALGFRQTSQEHCSPQLLPCAAPLWPSHQRDWCSTGDQEEA